MSCPASDGPDVPEELHEYAPSVELVYRVLCQEGESTIDALDEETSAARSTIVSALNQLESEGLVERREDPQMPSRYRWHVSTE